MNKRTLLVNRTSLLVNITRSHVNRRHLLVEKQIYKKRKYVYSLIRQAYFLSASSLVNSLKFIVYRTITLVNVTGLLVKMIYCYSPTVDVFFPENQCLSGFSSNNSYSNQITLL